MVRARVSSRVGPTDGIGISHVVSRRYGDGIPTIRAAVPSRLQCDEVGAFFPENSSTNAFGYRLVETLPNPGSDAKEPESGSRCRHQFFSRRAKAHPGDMGHGIRYLHEADLFDLPGPGLSCCPALVGIGARLGREVEPVHAEGQRLSDRGHDGLHSRLPNTVKTVQSADVSSCSRREHRPLSGDDVAHDPHEVLASLLVMELVEHEVAAAHGRHLGCTLGPSGVAEVFWQKSQTPSVPTAATTTGIAVLVPRVDHIAASWALVGRFDTVATAIWTSPTPLVSRPKCTS